MIEVSFIIVNYNTSQLTVNCVESIIEFTENVTFEVILIDNCSTEKSFLYLREKYGNLIIIENDDNVGFGRANNQGAKIAKGKYLFFLNSDTYLMNNASSFYLNFYNENVNFNIGVLGSILLNKDHTIGRSSSDLPSLKSILLNSVKGVIYRFFLLKNSGFVQAIIPEQESYKQVGQLLGANMFMERQLFVDICGFDELFFMYFEETDLQKRLSDIGKNCYLIRGPKIVHLEGQSNTSIRKYFNYYASLFKYFRKHYTIF